MSQSVEIVTQFVDLSSLKKAAALFGWQCVDKSKIRCYMSDSNKNKVFDHVLVNPSTDAKSFDIGVMDGQEKLSVTCDFWGGSIESSLGADLLKLKIAYAEQVFCDEYEGLGFVVSRTVDSENNIILESQKA